MIKQQYSAPQARLKFGLCISYNHLKVTTARQSEGVNVRFHSEKPVIVLWLCVFMLCGINMFSTLLISLITD